MMSRTARLRLLLTLLLILPFVICDLCLAQVVREPPMSVVVNEVLASNGGTIRDPQRQYEDWIELHNHGRFAVDVSGCYLTDDPARPTKWQIPAGSAAVTTIAPGGYLLIWADGDLSDSGLHAGFRLSDEGEEVSLFAPDGATLLDSLSYGSLITDVSYGRYPDGGSDLRVMDPTPGATNGVVYEGIAEPPQFDVTSRVCTGPITVTLTTATEGARIYYTTDGSKPYSIAREHPTGLTYVSPVLVNRTMTIRAMAWRAGWRQSEITEQRYVFLGRDVQTFTSPLAIAVVDTLGNSVSRTPVPAYSCFIDLGEQGRAWMAGPIDFAGAGAINVRGKSSEGFPQHQYHLEIRDEQGDDKDVPILGLPAESDWVLYGPYTDKSLMRNVLSYRWSNEMGRYAPRTRYIELFLNTDNTTVSMADYEGVYVLMEKIKISPNRVDIVELEPSDNAEPEITGGYIIKKDKFDGDDVSFNTSRGQTLIFEDPNGHDLTQTQRDWVRGYMNSFEMALYGSSFADPVNGYAKFIDVGSFIDSHILVELTKNIDGFRLSTYMHKDRNGKLVMGPAWDYNLSLGNADYLTGWMPSGWYFDQLGDGDYPYWRRLFNDPQFELQYADRWFALRRDLFATDRLLGMVEDYATLLDEPAARNFDRWPILGQYVWPNWFIAKTFREEIVWMQGWLHDRLAWMDSRIASQFAAAPPAFNRQGGQVESGFLLTMSGPGTIYYTTDGSDPKLLTGSGVSTTGTVVVPESASKRVLVPTGPVDDAWRSSGSFNDSAWRLASGGPGGVGFERSTGYENFFSLDVGPQMYGKNTSCYVRIPFTMSANLRNVTKGTLNVRYDDGFVAYLNGIEIARRNVAGTPTWNSAAGDIHDDVDAVNLESIEIADIRTILQRADNLLAIHAMNNSATSSDFLISAELTVIESEQESPAPQIFQYAGPIPLTESTRVIARSLSAGQWSASNDAVFAVGPVAESVRISEIMYHPADTGNPDDPNAEYIELMNVGGEAVNLGLCRLIDGIEFVFPSFVLEPAACCLVVKDPAVFESRYGPGLPVAGQYAGSLNNAGERLVLCDAAARTIHDFTYRDDWFRATDGGGFSLTLADPFSVDPNSLGDMAAWRPSENAGGSPGETD